MYLAHRFDQGSGAIQTSRTGLIQSVVNPSDKITSRYIPHEQVEGKGRLTKITSPEIKLCDRTISKMAWSAASAGCLPIVAAFEVPEAGLQQITFGPQPA